MPSQKERVCLIGSGNWGSAISKIIGRNLSQHSSQFDTDLRMWVFEEEVNGKKLSHIINDQHENVKYLPGIKLPENVKAEPDLLKAVDGATLLVFVIPHQFVKGICEQLKGRIHPNARAISLIKGVDVSNSGLKLVSSIIQESLQVDVSVLMGANIASEIAEEQFSETTIGCKNRSNGEAFKQIFNTHYFRCAIVEDVAGVELCGALKNIVAIGAGLVDGLRCGENTKAAIIRIGFMELRKFAKMYYGGVKDETFFESCGIADVITTCFGGRNRKVAEAHVRTGKTFDVLEKEMLNGQKLQGNLAAREVNMILKAKGETDK
ncbi:Glycerol-3-phosphate dehydrogenase [Rhizophlyctis rosea]|uniref:Glycerol-3-phosphate dehydrogenase [NAD(+)] n=1 Tax=Rhizophlyctis rosea TaxID=64517 RepID=A0AAD5X0P8_9FUNG|nr:Glycerol-3-phosphate dehydrogenase [Rhizophlyctis rosea]